ncbi:phosphoribosylglycinamide formyltransferase [Enterococcus sp. HY326]|uniref:phosphoribosylglycinamide formyltransferase n=1 Tax=Enterococcus sp. HY326 TaxID=2971265 RepID=UPI00223F6381|nr:phosphoribosylglycinamide formyltransferase [Enterococcus sp. HY326]
MTRPKVAVLASGNGSNFQVLAEAFQKGNIDGELVLLFSDQPKAYVLERSQQLGIEARSFSPKNFASKKAYEVTLLQLLMDKEIDLILLAGYMRIIGDTLLKAYPNRIINIHPSLLPDFPGLHGIQDAFEAGVTETGVTIHFIDDGVDTGPIIAQGKVTVSEDDTLESLEEKIHALEHQLYPQVVAKVIAENFK